MAGQNDDRDERFRLVFDTNLSRVVDYARRRVPAHEVDDVVSATFLVVWRRLEDLPAGEGALPWIYGVARRVVSDRYRARGRWQRLQVRLVGIAPADVSSIDLVSDVDVAWALGRLRGRDRTVLVLAYWEDLTPGEISQVLGISVNAATIRLHRARKRFATLMVSIIEDDERPAESHGGAP
jgi:RNA polymerase sigma-70 factor (ECF subfamily)